MRVLLIITIIVSLIGFGFISKTKPRKKGGALKTMPGSYAPVAVLELFTSEGCSSCPPADNLLPELAKLDSNIIPLSFHVDYWNRLGWTDPFSSSEYSNRQRDYAAFWRLESVYTPELVINGVDEVVGSNQQEAESAIRKALNEKSLVKIDIGNIKISEGKIRFNCQCEGQWKKNVLVACLVQKSAVMKVNAGENRGATLSHTNVVRSFEKQNASGKNEISLEFPDNLSAGNWLLAVYTQQKNNFKITGAALYNPN